MNSTRFFASLLLLVYAIYKPYDRELPLGEYDDEMPSSIKNFLEWFETNKIFARIFGFKHVLPGGNEEIPLMNIKKDNTEDDNLNEYKQYLREKRTSSVGKYKN